jgi:hypothetical protein
MEKHARGTRATAANIEHARMRGQFYCDKLSPCIPYDEKILDRFGADMQHHACVRQWCNAVPAREMRVRGGRIGSAG